MSNNVPNAGDGAAVRAAEAAALLLDARRHGHTIAGLPADVKPHTFADGYRIQEHLLDLDGRPIGLIKVGCTTSETQRIMNLDEPIGGCLATEAVYGSGAVLPVGSFHHPPLIECEFAMRVAVDVDPGRAVESVAEAVALADAVAPALELVDGRFDRQLDIDGPSVVADNSMATAAVLGSAVELSDGFNPQQLASITVRLEAEGSDGPELITEGVGANVLGDPWRSFHWALRHLGIRGRAIQAGTWIITGSCSGAPAAPVGRRLTAHFDGLGEVSVTITA